MEVIMGRKRKTVNKPYILRVNKNRPISVEFDFIPGKRISTGCYDYAGAIDFAEKWMANQGLKAPQTPTLREFASDFFSRRDRDSIYQRDKMFGRDFTTGHYEKLQRFVDQKIMPQFGDYLVTAITARMIENWLPYVTGKNGRELSADTKNKILGAFRSIMDEVKKKGFRDDNPAEDARSLTYRPKERPPLSVKAIVTLFPPEPEKRIEIWETSMWASYFSVLYDTGMRPSEAAALRVCDIYQTKNGLAVATSRSVSKEEKTIKERVKTTGKGYSERLGLLYGDTASLLLIHIDRFNLSGDDLLFWRPYKYPERHSHNLLTDDAANRHFKEVCRKMRVYENGLVCYSLRHTYETMRRGDMSDDLLAVSMGHTKLRSDYDHQKAEDLIRRLEEQRDRFFEYRERLTEESDIKRLGGSK